MKKKAKLLRTGIGMAVCRAGKNGMYIYHFAPPTGFQHARLNLSKNFPNYIPTEGKLLQQSNMNAERRVSAPVVK